MQNYTDIYDHLNSMGNNTQEEGPEFMTVNTLYGSQWPGMLFTEESWIMLSWQDNSILTYLRLISQEPSGWRRTQHHLKAQLDRSSFSSTGRKHSTKTEVFSRRAAVLNKAHSPHSQGDSSWLYPAAWLHLGLPGRTRKLHMMTSVYS